MADFREQLQTVLGSAYTIERELAGGGMARVFVATDTALGRRVVVKVLLPEASGAVSVERFRREIQLAARLQHPHIVPLLSAGEAGALLYYTMPFVVGQTLRAQLARDGALPITSAVRVMRDVTSALAHAHRHGVVHRDVKPENILIGEDGDALVADFGVAKALAAATAGGDGAAEGGALTSIGFALGTPAYMAPEQALGDATTDHRADLYALGVVAYEALAGSHPFAGRPAQALVAAHATESPEPLSRRRASVPPALTTLVMRLLSKHPADRPASADAVLTELESIATSSGGAAVTSPPGSRRRAAFVGAAATVLIVAIGAAWALRHRAPSPVQPAAGVALPRQQSVAVLPLVNAGGDTADAYFAAGMTDEVTGALARVPGLRVASRSAAALVGARQPLDVRDAGRRLDVGAVLAGRVRRQGTQLRLAVELVDVADGRTLWSETYAREGKDAFRMQDEIARAIAAALRVRLAGGERPAGQGTASVEAHDLVLRARYLTNLYTAPSLRRAIALYEQALALDSTYAAAWSGRGEAWIRLADDFVPASEAVPHIRTSVARALALDPTLADAHSQHASLLGYYDRNYRDAEREFTRALTLDSTLSGASADYANILTATGRADSGAAVLRRALRIDPLSPYLAFWAPRNLLYAGKLADAHAACAVAGDVSAELGHRCRIDLLFADARYAALLDTLRSEPAPSVRTHAYLAAALSRLGRQAEARREAALVEADAREHYLDERVPAQMYAVMGEPDRAIAWLERGFTSNAAILAYMNVDNLLAPLRTDPRFQAMLRRAALR
ncbi:MAG: protein kinase [Gemmatimonadaceae bacterium]